MIKAYRYSIQDLHEAWTDPDDFYAEENFTREIADIARELVKCGVPFAITSQGLYIFSNDIRRTLLGPLHDSSDIQRIIYDFTPTETYFTQENQ